MSKKSRTKSSKALSGSPTAKKKALKTRASSQTKPAKTQRTPGGKSTATIAKAGSHKAAPKQLNSSKSVSSPAGAKSGLSEGQKAPTFRLPRDGGEVVTLADYAGQKLVLFFYPRADTPGCTREAIDFTRLAGAFAAAGTAVLGISADPLKAQEKFRDKRLELAQNEWARFKANDSLECRNCHNYESMDFTRQSVRAQNMHTTYLASKEKTCIDCHKGIAHHLPHIPPGQGPSDSPGQVVPKEGGEALAPTADPAGEKKGG